MNGENSSFWLGRARREAWRFNSGWWLQKFLPWIIADGVLGAVAVLAIRSADQDLRWAGAIVLAIALLGLLVSAFQARRKFLFPADALARLDADLHLHNRLTSASQGIGEWPQRRPEVAFALRWNWPALTWPPLTAVALAVAALLIPLPDGRAKATTAKTEPAAWTATQEKIDALRKDEIVQREAVEELQQSLDALRKQPSDQWFRHESLEAGDHLQARTDQAMSELQKHLESALGVLEASRQIEQGQLAALEQPLDQALKDALQGMELGSLPLNREMLEQLRKLDPSKIRKLSVSECESLCQRLKQGIGTCSAGFCKGDKACEGLLALILGQNNGGINRGPGAAPLTLSDQKTDLGTKQTEGLANDDLSRAALGDLMGLSAGEHKVDKTESGPQQGGAMANAGSGGEAVWEQTATPAEQQALKRFFQ